MSQLDDLNRELRSLNNKFQLPEQEQKELLTRINHRIDSNKPKKRVRKEWKYYIASIATTLMIIIISVPFFGHDNQGLNRSSDPNLKQDPLITDITEDEITIHIMNYTSNNIKDMMIKVYENGDIKATQGVLNADGSSIEPAEKVEFHFLGNELGKGLVELELDFQHAIISDEIEEKVFTTTKMSIEIAGEREYFLKLYEESPTSYYLIEDENKLELKINNDFVKTIKNEIEIGVTQEQIENLLGSDYEMFLSQVFEKEIWQYSIGMREIDRSPNNAVFENEDLEKIKNGAIQAIISFQWNEDNQLDYYFVLYLDEKDGNVYAYHVFHDGREKLDFVY